MRAATRSQLEDLYTVLQAQGRLYTFRDPGAACLFKLRVNECYVLDFLAEHGAISVTALARTLGIHKSNASRITMALEARGLVETLADPRDRRAVILKATARGRATHKQVRDHLVDRLETALEQFSRRDISVAMAVLACITEDAKTRITGGAVPEAAPC